RRIESPPEDGADSLAAVVMNNDASILARLTHIELRVRVELASLNTDVLLRGATVAHRATVAPATRGGQVFRSANLPRHRPSGERQAADPSEHGFCAHVEVGRHQ